MMRSAVRGAVLVAATRPNVLLVTTDQHRTDALGCYGSTFAESPHLDALAADGVRYTESYTPSPVCESARASWITGTQVPIHNVWMNDVTRIRDGLANVIDPLGRAGYYTALFGKTHYDPVPNFDYKDVHTGNDDMRAPGMSEKDFLETYLVDQAMALLDGRVGALGADQPWYVHVSMVSPHPPSYVPVEYAHAYVNASIPGVKYGGEAELATFPGQLRAFADCDGPRSYGTAFPGGQPDAGLIREQRRQYYALAKYVDAQVGRLLGFLDRKGLRDSTLVIFTSDHGTELWDHRLEEKYNFFDSSWRVPLILRGPGLPQGAVRTFAQGVDVPATVLAAAGAVRPAGLQGFSLLAEGENPRSAGVAGALMQGYALATPDWKLMYYMDDGRGLLFDRVADTEELSNLFDDPAHAEVRARLVTALLRWRGGLEPVQWLHNHQRVGKYGNEIYSYDFTANLTGLEPERRLQADLLALPPRRATTLVV